MTNNSKHNTKRNIAWDKISNPLLHYLVIGLIFVVGILTLASHTLVHGLKPERHHSDIQHASIGCSAHSSTKNYELVFGQTEVSPTNLTLDRCDQITVKNSTNEIVEVAIGEHDHHAHVEGFEETTLKNGESYSFRLSQNGTYKIHDHDNESLHATLNVR